MSKTKAVLILASERRNFVLKLRKQGFTYVEIASKTLTHFGAKKLPKHWSDREAYNDVAAELTRLRKETQEETAELRQITLARYDTMLAALETKVTAGDTKAIDTALRIENDRRKLLGLDAPSQIKMDMDIDARVSHTIDLEGYNRSLASLTDAIRALIPPKSAGG